MHEKYTRMDEVKKKGEQVIVRHGDEVFIVMTAKKYEEMAATAIHNGLIVVTENTKDFKSSDVDVINPWEI